MMKYFDIHVHYGRKDSDGYSVPIAIENGTKETALELAKETDRFEYKDDVNCIDYVEEITEEEFRDMTQ